MKQEVEAQSFFIRIMAVVNQYKMYGVTSTAAEGPIKFFGTTTISGVVTQNPLVSETYIIKIFTRY